jgi:hypothetical protein
MAPNPLVLILSTLLVLSGAAAADAEPLESPIEGPSNVCFMDSGLRLVAGERITDAHLGIHLMSIEVSGPRGAYTLSEGNNFATPARLGATVLQAETFSIHRVREDGEVRYVVMAYADFAPSERRALIWLSGPALVGANRERIFRRITVGPRATRCDVGFEYGWNLED